MVSSYYGKSPILYTTDEFYRDYLYPDFDKNDIWIRSIYSKPSKIHAWKIWQYNPRGKIDGIKGSVDLNVLNQ